MICDNHQWHEFYASVMKVRECYCCGALEKYFGGVWIPEIKEL